MNVTELDKAIQIKTIELEAAQQVGKSHHELAKLYRELKELRYQRVQAELKEKHPKEESVD